MFLTHGDIQFGINRLFGRENQNQKHDELMKMNANHADRQLMNGQSHDEIAKEIRTSRSSPGERKAFASTAGRSIAVNAVAASNGAASGGLGNLG